MEKEILCFDEVNFNKEMPNLTYSFQTSYIIFNDNVKANNYDYIVITC